MIHPMIQVDMKTVLSGLYDFSAAAAIGSMGSLNADPTGPFLCRHDPERRVSGVFCVYFQG